MMHDHEPALTCAGLVKRFGERSALAGVDLECRGGMVTAVIGPNGAGKSTLFRAAAGLLQLDQGRIRIRGQAPGTVAAQLAVSFLPEQPDLYPGLSVWEHVVFVALAYRLSSWREQAGRLLDRFGLADRQDALPHELSQGLRRRVALVMALLHGADVLLLDEPFNGLDPRNAGELRAMIGELARAGVCVVIATHILSDVERLADWIALLDRGRVTAKGTADQLRDLAGLDPAADLEAAYMVLTGAGDGVGIDGR